MVKRIAVINDLSGLGKCSLTAAIPVLSVMGMQACPIPTAILSNQTGYDSYYCDDYTDKLDYFTTEWKKRNIEFQSIYTGYLGSPSQVKKILTFCSTFKKKDTLLFVDPVMGDMGHVYDIYTPEFCEQMKLLVSQANVITPNLTECCLLTGCDYSELITHQKDEDYLMRIEQMAKPLLTCGPDTIIITGITYQSSKDSLEKYYNLLITSKECHIVCSKIHGGSYSGTGDLLASVVCAGITRGESPLKALKRAVQFIETALIQTVAEKVPRNDGIQFEPYLYQLLDDQTRRRIQNENPALL